jgi:hypothetical protein
MMLEDPVGTARNDAGPDDAGLPAAARITHVPLGGGRLELLVVPGDAAPAEIEARRWVERGDPQEPPVVVPLYGTVVIWCPQRAAILGPMPQLGAVQDAVTDFARCEAELGRIEREVAAALDVLDEDAPLAVEFDERHLDRQPVVAERFGRSVAIRADLARLVPTVHRPAQHPPTLASQVGERLRERTRLVDRLEFLQGKAEVLERVYDLCAQRVGDFAVARRHLRLEWVIIVLLAAELVVLLVELLALTGTAPAP